MNYKIKLLFMATVLFGVTQFGLAASVVKTVYIDGAEVTQATAPAGLSWSSDYLTIGSEGTRGYMYNEYLGKIGDFAIYTGVLSADRVAAHYAARTSYSSYTSAVTTDVPTLWLKFNDASTTNGATATNSGSVTAKNGSYVITGDSGPINKVTGFVSGSYAIQFAGPKGTSGGGSCVDVLDTEGDFSSLTNGDISIELWVNYTDTVDYPRFFQHNGSWDSTGAYGISVNDSNQLVVSGGGATNYASYPVDINNGTWHHIVVTYNSTYDQPPAAGTYEAEVGADNPVVWLRFDDAAPKDYSATGSNHWVGYGSAATIVDKVGGIGKSVYLNGSNGAGVYGVAVANGPNAPAAVNGSYAVYGNQYAFTPNDITIEFWYKTLPVGQPQPADYGAFFQQFGSYTHEPCAPAVGNCTGQIRVFGGSGAGYTGVSPKFDQKWHQMVVTYDENYLGDPNRMFVKLYLDGVFRDDTNFTGLRAKLGPEMSHMIIGAEGDIGNTYSLIPGYYDEFAIYAGVLDADRVMSHYVAWQPKDCAKYIERGYGGSADINQDCKVNFGDFAELALNWTKCNKPSTAHCLANW